MGGSELQISENDTMDRDTWTVQLEGEVLHSWLKGHQSFWSSSDSVDDIYGEHPRNLWHKVERLNFSKELLRSLMNIRGMFFGRMRLR